MKDCCCSHRTKERTQEEKNALTARINRIAGQMNGVKNMIENDRYCADILIQLAAIDKSVKSLAGVLLERHLHSCLVEDIQNGKSESVDEIIELFKRFQ
ncbi:MAG: metal-sensing transcriptional repressor [Clostridia bacterium]|nr:metal-sensing transcriptional repressor [Clostridia bacterium]